MSCFRTVVCCMVVFSAIFHRCSNAPDITVRRDSVIYTLPDDTYEPNDSLKQAAVFSTGIHDSLFCYNDDWYRIPVIHNHYIVCRLAYKRPGYVLDMALYSSGDSIISESYYYKSQCQIDYSADADTAVYVKVFPHSGDSLLLKEYSLTIYDCPDDSFESNNTLSRAKKLSAGGSYTLENFDDDYFMIQPKDSVVDASVTFNPDSVNLSMIMLNGRGNILATAGDIKPGIRRIRYSLDTLDTVFYRITYGTTNQVSDFHHQYALTFKTHADDSLEPNDDYQHAYRYPVNLTAVDSTCIIDNLLYRDKDQFFITVYAAKADFRVVFSDTTVPLKLLIYEKTGSGYQSSNSCGYSTGSNYGLACAQTYNSSATWYVQVSADSLSALNSYRLEITPRK